MFAGVVRWHPLPLHRFASVIEGYINGSPRIILLTWDNSEVQDSSYFDIAKSWIHGKVPDYWNIPTGTFSEASLTLMCHLNWLGGASYLWLSGRQISDDSPDWWTNDVSSWPWHSRKTQFIFIIFTVFLSYWSLLGRNFPSDDGYTVFCRINAPGTEAENEPLPWSHLDEINGGHTPMP